MYCSAVGGVSLYSNTNRNRSLILSLDSRLGALLHACSAQHLVDSGREIRMRFSSTEREDPFETFRLGEEIAYGCCGNKGYWNIYAPGGRIKV